MKCRPAAAAVLVWLVLAACGVQPGNAEIRQTIDKGSHMSDEDLDASFDRPPPPEVAPVVRDGKRYTQLIGTHDDSVGQSGGLLEVADAASGKRLGVIKVYDNRRDPDLEGDVQDIFFASMAFDGSGKLIITDETGRRFAVDTGTGESRQLP